MKTNLECKLDRLITIPQPQTLTCLPQPREPQDQSLAKNHSQTGEAQSQKLHLQPGLQHWKNQNSEWHSINIATVGLYNRLPLKLTCICHTMYQLVLYVGWVRRPSYSFAMSKILVHLSCLSFQFIISDYFGHSFTILEDSQDIIFSIDLKATFSKFQKYDKL